MAGSLDTNRIDALEVPVGSLHADWSDDWCPTIRSPSTRSALAANARLSRRLGAQLARQLDCPALVPGSLEPEDLRALQALIAAPERFLRLCGLASLAPLLAATVDGRATRRLHEIFTTAEIKLALSCRDLVVAGGDQTVDHTRLLDVVTHAGPRLVQAWAASLPEAFRARVRLMLKKASSFAPDSGSADPVAPQMVRRIAAHLSAPPLSGAPVHARLQ